MNCVFQEMKRGCCISSIFVSAVDYGDLVDYFVDALGIISTLFKIMRQEPVVTRPGSEFDWQKLRALARQVQEWLIVAVDECRLWFTAECCARASKHSCATICAID